MGEIQKEGVGEIQKEGEGSGMGKGMRGKGKGMSGWGWEQRGGDARENFQLYHLHRQNIMLSHSIPRIVQKAWLKFVNKRNAVGIKIGCFYRYKECTFECGTRAACVAHARRKHTNKLIGPCNFCGTYYAHSTDSMKHHVNECAGGTTSSYDTDV